MAKVIIYTDPQTGECNVVRPAPHARRFLAGLTARDGKKHPMAGARMPAAWSDEEIAVAIDAGAAENDQAFADRVLATQLVTLEDGRQIPLTEYAPDARVYDQSAEPAERTWRAAWRRRTSGFGTDMKRARDLHMARIRVARDRQLGRLDVDYMRADERADDAEKKRIAAEKQRLRDLPASFGATLAAAKTEDQLQACWPAGIERTEA